MTFDKAFLDLDGTVHLSGKIIDSVNIELRRLDALGTRFHYMTNNTSISSNEYMTKLKALDLPLHKGSVISPTLVLADWLKRSGSGRFFSVGTTTFREELRTLSGSEEDMVAPDCVIVAFDKEVTYEKLETACGLINSGIPYYLTHIDLACPSVNGPIPDCGAIGRLIEATTGVRPSGHFGKPGDAMLAYLKSKIAPQERILVAGDRVYTDAAIGLRLEAETVLVCTGEYKRGQEVIDSRINVVDTLAAYLRTLPLESAFV